MCTTTHTEFIYVNVHMGYCVYMALSTDKGFPVDSDVNVLGNSRMF